MKLDKEIRTNGEEYKFGKNTCTRPKNVDGFHKHTKTLDAVPRKQISQGFRKIGIKTKLRNYIKIIYEATRNYVIG